MGRRFLLAAGAVALLAGMGQAQDGGSAATLRIGWAQADITPQRPACLGGMTSVRVSTSVRDPLTATALALEAPYQEGRPEPVIFISCDLRSITNDIRDGVRAVLKTALPDVDSMRVILNGTHTHNAPPLNSFGMPLDAMQEPEYTAFAVPRIAAVAEQAWKNRQPGGVSFGLGHAVIGHNRIMALASGKSVMGGKLDRPDFSHVEGYEDHAAHFLFTFDADGKLSGAVVNVACTSQVSQSQSAVSADFWHEARVELRRRLGTGLYVLPQCSAAGDQMSRPYVDARAEARMEKLSGRDRRGQIALRIADAAERVFSVVKDHAERRPVLAHRGGPVPLKRRIVSEADYQQVQDAAAKARIVYEKALAEAKDKPALLKDAAWLRDSTRAFRRMRQGETLKRRYTQQQADEPFLAELHVIRLGDMAFATNPFELYLDYGVRIKGRSKAVQTFVVELAGSGSYVPTARSVAGGAYGAIPTSTEVGPEGGHELVNWTVAAIEGLWKQ